MATRIKEKYLAEAIPALKQKFGYKNVMEIPKLSKIVINMGLGDCKDNAKAMEMAVNELTTIAGQKPMVTKAKKSIANFKVREGMNVGAKVTLRGARMEEFMDKLVSVARPSTAAATMPWESVNSCCSRKSSTTRSRRSAAWKSFS